LEDGFQEVSFTKILLKSKPMLSFALLKMEWTLALVFLFIV